MAGTRVALLLILPLTSVRGTSAEPGAAQGSSMLLLRSYSFVASIRRLSCGYFVSVIIHWSAFLMQVMTHRINLVLVVFYIMLGDSYPARRQIAQAAAVAMKAFRWAAGYCAVLEADSRRSLQLTHSKSQLSTGGIGEIIGARPQNDEHYTSRINDCQGRSADLQSTRSSVSRSLPINTPNVDQ